MIDFYFFTILVAFTNFINRRFAFFLMVFGVAYFLLILPSTKLDYDAYKEVYDNAYIINDYPWVASKTTIYAEKFYIWYCALYGVFLPFGFPSFLALNFLLSVLISFLVLNKMKDGSIKYFYWLFLMSTVVPTIFYFSPRSSISYVFIFIGFFFLTNRKVLYSIIFLLMGITMHSQYSLITLLFVISFIFFILFGKTRKDKFKIIFLISVPLFISLIFFNQIEGLMKSVLSLLPNADFAHSKLGVMMKIKRTGIRLSGILSIFIYPYMINTLEIQNHRYGTQYFFEDKKLDTYFLYLLYAIVVYGAVINLAFINDPHMAGRLSRFSDYTGMGLIIPVFLGLYFKRNLIYVILFVFILITPIVFPGIYINVNWGISF